MTNIQLLRSIAMNRGVFLTALFFSIFLVISNITAQQKGSFNQTINFKGENRIISFYVPDDYNPDSSYKLMVCLHGLGDNSTNYRNALVNSLSWKTNIPNTIFACPDGGSDQGKDFYDPPGDEEIIPTIIDSIIKNYNIDTNHIILQGFSLGGRSALKYGLDNPEKFYGLLLNTPAIQGGEDAFNNPMAGLIYNYENASKIKIAIIHGGEDYAYLAPIAIAYEELIMNNGIVMESTVDGMGHNIPSWSFMSKCIEFLENPTPYNFDVGVLDIEIPERTCSPMVKPSLLVRNLGSETVTNLNYSYELNGELAEETWTGELLSFQVTTIELSELDLPEGENILKVDVQSINDGNDDAVIDNNEKMKTCKMIVKGMTLPFTEGFEGNDFPPVDWIQKESGNIFSWMADDVVAKDGDWSMFMLNTILLFYTMGTQEDFFTPIIDLTSIENPAMVFDYAYNYHRYTPPYFTEEVNFSDTLEIFVSTDCGVTFERVFKKGGTELATTDEPIINALQLQQCQFIPMNDEWGKVFVDFTPYSSSDKAIVKLSYISGQGGSINIDNIAFLDGSTIGVNEQKSSDGLSIYPNPVKDFAIIDFEIKQSDNIEIKVMDILGNEVLRYNKGNLGTGYYRYNLNLGSLNSGVYFVRVAGSNINLMERLIVE